MVGAKGGGGGTDGDAAPVAPSASHPSIRCRPHRLPRPVGLRDSSRRRTGQRAPTETNASSPRSGPRRSRHGTMVHRVRCRDRHPPPCPSLVRWHRTSRPAPGGPVANRTGGRSPSRPFLPCPLTLEPGPARIDHPLGGHGVGRSTARGRHGLPVALPLRVHHRCRHRGVRHRGGPRRHSSTRRVPHRELGPRYDRYRRPVAPSTQGFGAIPDLNALIRDRMIVVATDYEGLGTPGVRLPGRTE